MKLLLTYMQYEQACGLQVLQLFLGMFFRLVANVGIFQRGFISSGDYRQIVLQDEGLLEKSNGGDRQRNRGKRTKERWTGKLPLPGFFPAWECSWDWACSPSSPSRTSRECCLDSSEVLGLLRLALWPPAC
jgi:hypothetical protein